MPGETPAADAADTVDTEGDAMVGGGAGAPSADGA